MFQKTTYISQNFFRRLFCVTSAWTRCNVSLSRPRWSTSTIASDLPLFSILATCSMPSRVAISFRVAKRSGKCELHGCRPVAWKDWVMSPVVICVKAYTAHIKWNCTASVSAITDLLNSSRSIRIEFLNRLSTFWSHGWRKCEVFAEDSTIAQQLFTPFSSQVRPFREKWPSIHTT